MTQLSKRLKIEELGDQSSLIFTNDDNSTSIIAFDRSGVHVNGVDITDAVVGVDPTPVVRTNNPIVGTNSVNANLSELDNAIGTDVTPASRTTGPVAAANSVNTNIDALDTAIGADHTPLTRTVGQTAVANAVNANIDALDTAIGADAQMTGAGKNISRSNSVYQNLDALDAYKTVRTVKKTIGGVGVASCDYNFATAENTNEQVITLTGLIPAKARVLDCFTYTNNVFTGATTLVAEVGTTSSGHELLASATIYAADAINAMATDHSMTIIPAAAAADVYVAATPGANWNLVTAGKVSVYVTFIDVLNV